MKVHANRSVRRAAFTLVEMMVVIVILGLLATMVVPNVIGNMDRAVKGKIKVEIVTIDSALDSYALHDAGRYPDSLVPLVTPDTNGQKYLKMDVLPKDPWGVEYQYEAPAPGQKVPRIFTLGKDRQVGGYGDDRDIDNRMIRNGDLD